MAILVTAGVMLVMAVGKASALTVVEPFNASGGGVYLPSPDDGRPQH